VSGDPGIGDPRWRGVVERWLPGGILAYSLWSLAGNLSELAGLFGPAPWQRLTRPEGALYHPLWKWVLVSEMVASALLLIGCVGALALLLARDRRFPAVFAGLLLANLLWCGVDWLGASRAAASLPADSARLVRDAAASSLLTGALLAVGSLGWMGLTRRWRAQVGGGPAPGHKE